MDRTTSALTAAREVARFLIKQAENLDDTTPEDVDLLGQDLLGWAREQQCQLDQAAALLVATLQGQSTIRGAWKTALAFYLADLRKQGAQGSEYRESI